MDYNIKIGDNGLFLSLLGVLFIGFKICGVIDWDWIWVLTPVWGSWIIAIVTLITFKIYDYIRLHHHRHRRQ